jgi:hypothetical protein
VKTVRIADITVGQIDIRDSESIVGIHREKVEYVLDVLKDKSWQGNQVKAEIAN